MPLTFDKQAQYEVGRIQERFAALCKQMNLEGKEAAHVALAMTRLVRNLLEFYPHEIQTALTEQVIKPFLSHESANGEAGRLITLN